MKTLSTEENTHDAAEHWRYGWVIILAWLGQKGSQQKVVEYKQEEGQRDFKKNSTTKCKGMQVLGFSVKQK
jgi:hypothetical protein